MSASESPADASARGGRVTARESAAKAAGLAKAQARARAAQAERLARLQVPAGFAGIDDFLAALAGLLDRMGRRHHQQDLAAAAGVGTSTITKYLARPPKPKRRPSQPVLDRLSAWWRQHQNAAPRPDPAPTKAAGRVRGAVSLRALPPELLSRAERTARLRNLTLLQFLAQLLDRHCPSTLELDLDR